MRLFIFLIFCLDFTSSNAQDSSIKNRLCSRSWQQRQTSVVWNFEESGHFSAILVWANKKGSGFTAKKGTYSLDDSAKTLKVTFDSTYIVHSKDSFSVSRDIGSQDWRLITVANYKIVLSRPPVWEFEKRNIANDDKNIIVTLDVGKKKRRDMKQRR